MSSAAQVLANQSNAQLSTGPRSVEGKAASSRNSAKHGFRGRLHIRPEEQEEFDALCTAHYVELDPQGPLENLVFDKFIAATWQLLRIQALECEAIAESGFENPILDKISRYHQIHERAMYKSLRELRALQTERAIRDRVGEKSTAGLPALADSAEVTKRTQFFSSGSALRNFHRTTSAEANRMLQDFHHRQESESILASPRR